MITDKFRHIVFRLLALILLTAGSAAGAGAVSTEITLIPDPANMQGTISGANIQPLESMYQDGVELRFSTGTGSVAPAYWASSKHLRIYDGNDFILEAPAPISAVVFEVDQYKNGAETLWPITEDGMFEHAEFDSENSRYICRPSYLGKMMIFQVSGAQLRIRAITLTLESDVAPGLPSAPVISPASKSFTESFNATITTSTEGGRIYYTLDGSEPSETAGTLYSAPVAIPEGADVTLKAVTVNDNGTSAVTSAEYHFVHTYPLTVRPTKPGTVDMYLATLNFTDSFTQETTFRISAGEEVYCEMYVNNGTYKIDRITANGEPQSFDLEKPYLYFIMPEHPVDIEVSSVFSPNSPSEPGEAQLKKRHMLTVVYNPVGAGRVESYTLEAGEFPYLYASCNSGYKFVNWTRNGEVIGTDRELNISMPNEDMVVTVNCIYAPTGPSEPEQPKLMHPLTATCSPAGAATMYVSASEVAFGENWTVRANPNDGYVIRGWIVNGEEVPKSQNSISGTMTDKGAQVVALFRYNPSLPSEPTENYFDPISGRMIVDHFQPGSLFQTIYQLCGRNYTNIGHLIVKGTLNAYDLNGMTSLSGVETIDLSRTSGITSVPGNVFTNLPATSIILPQTVTQMGSKVFSGCTNLSSLTVHATVPPVCGSTTFQEFTAAGSCIVYVPEESIPLYEAAEGWKNFLIQKIDTDAHVLEVSLPRACSDGRYKNKFIELVNLATGLRQKYVISDRLIYTFNGLQKDEQYNVYLNSQEGLEIGRIENIMIPAGDLSVSFDRLLELYDVAAGVIAGTEDVTDAVTVEWLKPQADGTALYLRRSAAMGEVPEGQELICRVTLPESLGRSWLQPADIRITVGADSYKPEIRLTEIPTVTLSGRVVDGDGKPLRDASVAAQQTVNGRYQRSFSVRTDRQGLWSLKVLELPETRMTYSAPECVNRVDTIVSSADGLATIALGDIALRSLVGARINYSFTYRAAGEESSSQFFNDYDNVSFSIENLTQERAHTDFSNQYPVLAVLDENISRGDCLRITATSRKNAFNPIVVEVKIGADQRAEALFEIVGKGGIRANFEMTDNPAVVGMLYDAAGQLNTKGIFADGALSLTELEDGDYTLVTMGQSVILNSIQRLAGFSEIGLTEGKDYLATRVTVEAGKISEVNIREIPAVDESLFTFTSPEATAVNFNKTSVITGGYLTLNTRMDFKPVHKPGVSDVVLTVDFPDGCELVSGSVMRGPSPVAYSFDGNRLSVPMGDNYQLLVRFCVIPTRGGTLNLTASTSFVLNGNRMAQPLGTASANVKAMEIQAPATVSRPEFIVTGTAGRNARVEVYSAGEIVGTAKADRNGAWSAACVVDKPANLASISVSAKIKDPAMDEAIWTASREILYDEYAISEGSVEMLLASGGSVMFDIEKGTASSTSYNFNNAQNVTFLVRFSDNDPFKLSKIVLNVFKSDGNVVKLVPVFDTKQQCWVATGYFETNASPKNVSVDYTVNTPSKFDAGFLARNLKPTVDASGEMAEEQAALRAATDAFLNAEGEAMTESLREMLGYVGMEIPPADGVELTEAEIEAYVNSLDDQDVDYTSALIAATVNDSSVAEMMEGVTITDCFGLTESALIEEGYLSFTRTDGTEGYYRATEETMEFVDFANDVRFIVRLDAASPLAAALRAPADSDEGWRDRVGRVAERVKELAENVYGLFNSVSENLAKAIDDARFDVNLLTADLKYLEDTGSNNFILKGILKSKLALKTKILNGLQNTRNWMNQNLAQWMKSTGTAGKVAGKFFSVSALVMDAADCYLDMCKLVDLKHSLTSPCKNATESVERLRGNVSKMIAASGVYYVGKLGCDVAEILGFTAGIAALIPSGGTSTACILAAAGVMAGNLAISWAYDKSLEIFTNNTLSSYEKVKRLCKEEDNEPEDYPQDENDFDPADNSLTDKNHYFDTKDPSTPEVTGIIDPAGYVYEGVPSNRVEGVQATIYYKETVENMYGDLVENIVLWDAEEYAQHNPLFTDENGMYQWDVPQGLWQVKFEKDGYQTARSEWLPVPPPQLDVNVGIVQARQPEIVEARAYETGIEVQFDKFMDVSTLTGGNIFVTAAGEKVEGEIILLDLEVCDPYAKEGETEDITHYASRLRYVPTVPLSMSQGEVRLTVSRNVLSYAGIPMTENFTQLLDIEKEVQAIAADDVKVLYGGEKELTVFALPFDAAAGRTLRIANSSELVASLESDELILDDEGKAVLRIHGELPGTSELMFSIPDVTVTGSATVNVLPEIVTAEAPTASRANGTAVYRGSKVALATDSKDGVIYFTTDGSCPCDPEGTRRRYTVPIIIDKDMQIQAMTQVGTDGKEVSETAVFDYTIKTSDLDISVAEGWTWVSHNLDVILSPDAFTSDARVERILGQTSELVRDPKFGFIGNLRELKPTESYKLNAAAGTSRVRLSDAAWNPSTPIALEAGWNWIGYPVGQTMSVAEAFAQCDPDALDYIVGQNGFSQYDGETWTGTLETLVPGAGYMYNSQSAKELVYNTAIVSKAGAQNVTGISSSRFALDVHKYPMVMPVVASLTDTDGTCVSADGFEVYAFAGSECRGLGRVVGDMVMMNIYGRPGDKVELRVFCGDDPVASSPSEEFSEEMLGSVLDPYRLNIGGATGIDTFDVTGGLSVSVYNHILTISGIAPELIDSVELYSTDGSKSFRTHAVTESGVNIEVLPAGTYIVVVRSGDSYSYHKTLVH